MIEINWQLFKAKFNGKETSVFENLAYHLFCTEYNINKGIFRFKNQTGIETEPIDFDNQTIGFQAKYYDTKIADNKSDIIDSIKKAKRENLGLDKILFYLNQEFSESSTKGIKEPAYKTEIESEAKKLNVTIEWRVPSHFERQLALPENQYLADYFFYSGNNIIDFIEGLKTHAESLFQVIQTDIVFNSTSIKIDKNELIQNITNELEQPKAIILSGEGGSGKTAVIKDLFQKLQNSVPFYLFKAVEFNVTDSKSFFNTYGEFNLIDFIKIHTEEKTKIVVIDSAERVSDIENQEFFKEFLSELISNSWSIIFTTRLSYLDDLRFLFLSVYRLQFREINIHNLSEDELQNLSNQYQFDLPENIRVKNILKNPFYLGEYLRNYSKYDKNLLYNQFKEVIWSSKILNSSVKNKNIHISREKCFLNIVKIRSEHNSFYIQPTECTDEVLSLLLKDEIIGYDNKIGNYFISHDIYEEWGLVILIERAYITAIDYNSFLSNIGSSLIIRRAFRQWMSDKLAENIENIKLFIEEILNDTGVQSFWKDEIIIAVLLSSYSEIFFSAFKEEFLKNDCDFLNRIIFLLRIGCKEVDNYLSQTFTESESINLNYLFTKPKGLGWDTTIKFLHNNISKLPISCLHHILPLLTDWCCNTKRGKTTRYTGLIALHYYKEIKKDYKYSSDFTERLISIIIQSSNEIKEELTIIFDKVLSENKINNQDLYFDLCESVISSDAGNLSIVIALPNYVLKLARLLWYKNEDKKGYHSSYNIESHYGISDNVHREYFPASAYQTPVYYLLKFSFKNTIDFIIDFTNKTVTNYAKSGFEEYLEETEIILNEETTIKQFTSSSLWNMYRGCSSPVTPYLLQSIHMALEKYLLETAVNTEAEIVENWLIFLIKNSVSSSISAVVTSIVLAHPDKFFNVAKILFSCPQFLQYDKMRALMGEHQAKSLYLFGLGMDYKDKKFEQERIKSCEDTHRTEYLEDLIIKYQFFNIGNITEEEFENRQKTIWNIIDNLLLNIPEKSKEKDNDKSKRILLSRIDRRNMKPKVETQGNNLVVDFNPQMDEDLVQHSKNSIAESLKSMKFSALKLWSSNKIENDLKYENYPQYNNDISIVLKETKEIVEILKDNPSYEFLLFNSSIPAYTSSVLIQYYSLDLSDEDKMFCKQIILEFATTPFRSGYDYQMSDGVEVSISSLPYFCELYPADKDDFLIILLLILFDEHPIGHYKRVCDYSIESIINTLWKNSSEDAIKMLYGYIKLKPHFDEIYGEYRKSSQWLRYSQQEVLEKFCTEKETIIEECFSSSFETIDLDIDKYTLTDLEIIFKLIPYDTNNQDLTNLVLQILPVFSSNLLDRNEDVDYTLRYKIFTKISWFLLFRNANDIEKYIQPFIDNYSVSKEMASFFEQMIFTEDKTERYEQFWIIWESFYSKVIENAYHPNYDQSKVIHNYLLAWDNWKKTVVNWHSLKEKEKIFYKKVVKDIGNHPAVLDSIAKFLNEIGSEYLNEGIFWISDMIVKNADNKRETNTVFYIEKLTRKYIYLNRNKVKKEIMIKNKILIILNFLIERGSVNAYLLREDIL
jgi:hypothetical protein